MPDSYQFIEKNAEDSDFQPFVQYDTYTSY